MSLTRPENWLENSPYNQPQAGRRDMALKRATSIARLKREKNAREQSDIKSRNRDDKDQKHRDEREKREEKEKHDTKHEKDTKQREETKHREERHTERHHKERQIERHKSELRHSGYDGRREHSVTVVVPAAVRPPPEYKPVYRGHVTVDTTKAKSNIDVVRLCIHELGWREIFTSRREPCDVYWHAISFGDHGELTSGRINKFPGIQDMLSKINLFRALDTMRNLYPAEYTFYPKSWFLPYQFHDFSNEVRQQLEKKVKPKPTYIVKPSEGSQGEGIYLLREPHQYSSLNGRCHIVQEYLSNVFLLERFKFDLRVYVTLTSVDPLEFYICKEGLARFSTIPYETPTNKNMQEVYMHLTNYSLNKRSSTFNKSDKEEEGSKRKLSTVLLQMEKLGYDVETVWRDVEHIVCKTMFAVVGELKVQHQTQLPQSKPGPKCFQILGFDIILMRDLKPMLLEVNANPSLSIFGEQEVSPGVVECIPSLKDEEVKFPLVRDTLLLVAPKNKYSRKRRHLKRRQETKRSPEHETAIVIKMDDMNLNENHMKNSDPSLNVKETAIRILDPSMEVDEEKKDDSDDKNSDDSDEKMTDERGSDSENPTSDDESGRDDDGKKKEEEKDEVESCLKKIYPEIYGPQFNFLRIMDRLSALFIRSLGVRGATRIGPTAFRTFARKCRLNRRGVTNASIDILYIDMQRKWEFMNPDRTSGIGFQGFVDSCFEIARRKFYLPNRRESLESLLDYCEEGLDEHRREEESIRRRFAQPPRKLARRPVHLFQRSTITSLEEESVQELYENSLARRHTTITKSYDIHTYMSRRKKENYRPKPLRLYDSDDD